MLKPKFFSTKVGNTTTNPTSLDDTATAEENISTSNEQFHLLKYWLSSKIIDRTMFVIMMVVNTIVILVLLFKKL